MKALGVPHKHKIILPATLQHVIPGEMPINLLAEVKPYGKLHLLAADAWMAFRARAFAEGIKTFKPTSSADTYRSLATQTIAWNDRMQLTPIENVKPRVYQGKNWYLKKGKAPIAQPGKSNHNLGLSVDVSEASGERLAFMAEFAALYGFTWELDSEPWHINYYVGDRVPALVQQWKQAKSLQ
jgi:LAS superfamily LD-carboxypeptidase LdcB